MQLRRRTIVWSAGILAGILMLWMVLPSNPPEPSYKGKKLREWLEPFSSKDPETRQPAVEAFRHMGSNSIPLLVEWIQYETPAWKTRVFRFSEPVLSKLPFSIKKTLYSLEDERNIRAYSVLEAIPRLGPEIKIAIFELRKVLKNPKTSGEVRLRIRATLAAINANHPDADVRKYAQESLPF